jgi:hypothetical protein
MADFSRMKVQPSEAAAQEADTVIKLSHIELEQKRLKVMERATNVMLLTTLLTVGMLVVLSIILAISLQQLRASLDAISTAVGPTAVASMVGKVQHSLDNAVGSSGNVLALTESVETMGAQLMRATNQSIALLAKANTMTASLMEHPTVQLSLGGAGGLGA